MEHLYKYAPHNESRRQLKRMTENEIMIRKNGVIGLSVMEGKKTKSRKENPFF